MAKKHRVAEVTTPFREPTPKQELDWAMERAVEKAVLAHPRTQKLREAIKQRMMKAAGSENGDEAKTPPTRKKK